MFVPLPDWRWYFFRCQHHRIKFMEEKINAIWLSVFRVRHLSDLHGELGSDFRTMARNLLNYLQNVTALRANQHGDFLSLTQESVNALIKFPSFYSSFDLYSRQMKINRFSKSKTVQAIKPRLQCLFRVFFFFLLNSYVTFCYGAGLSSFARFFLTAFQGVCDSFTNSGPRVPPYLSQQSKTNVDYFSPRGGRLDWHC